MISQTAFEATLNGLICLSLLPGVFDKWKDFDEERGFRERLMEKRGLREMLMEREG